MNIDGIQLSAIVSLLIALSVASERLVEIVKGIIPVLNRQHPTPWKEGVRRSTLQMMAVAAGVVTVCLARTSIPASVFDVSGWGGVLALGLLASGGSGFWNSILTYVLKVKEIKSAEATEKKREAVGSTTLGP